MVNCNGRGYNGDMADATQGAKALGAWEETLIPYVDAADAMFRRAAHAGPPDALQLEVLEALDREQHDALQELLALSRPD